MIQLMLCDDHALVLGGMEKLINCFHDMNVVATATSGEEALQHLNLGILPDILLLDIGMPNGINGYEVAHRVRLHWPTVKVLVATQSTEPMALLWMIKLGARGFISKNIQPPVLQAAIENVYEGSYYFNSPTDRHAYKVYVNTAAAIELNKKTASTLTAKEMKVAKLMATDMTYKEMASVLKLTVSTIESHRQNIFKKLCVANKVEVVLFMVRMGLV